MMHVKTNLRLDHTNCSASTILNVHLYYVHDTRALQSLHRALVTSSASAHELQGESRLHVLVLVLATLIKRIPAQ